MSKSSPESIPLSKPNIGTKEREYVMRVLNSSRLALGPMLDQFEAQMAAFCGVKHAVAVNSGTSALHLIVKSLGIGAGDEVVTTPFSFIASSNCLLFENAHPRFVDIDPATLSFNMEQLQTAISPATKGILGIDVFGAPAPWPALQELATQHGLHLIDDACEAPGARIGDTPIGAWGDAAAFGFYPNKQMTTGEGGCITTNSDTLAELCRSMRNQGRAVRERMEHVRLGYNYRMDELAAALGCAQLERLPGLLAARERVATAYTEALEPYVESLILPATPTTMPNVTGKNQLPVTRSWFVYVIRLREDFTDDARDLALKLLRERGIGCASYFPSIHLQPYYRERFGYKTGDFPVCESISNRSLALPFYPALLPGQIFTIGDILGDILPQLPKKVKTF
ncbi:MAG: DegT/DnrJ/EryC1/StrS family aminotransferase [Bacteroidota bacterium]